MSANAGAPGLRRSWLGVATATVVAGAAWAGFWWLAVPRHDLCAAILPAPAGCRSVDRVPTATLWTVIVAVLYLTAATTALVRPAGRWWPFTTAMAVLTVAGVWGLWSVLYAGG